MTAAWPYLATTSAAVLLLILFWQDIRTRTVSLWLLVTLIVLVFILRSGQVGFWQEMAFNISFVMVQWGLLAGYLSAKHGRLLQPVGRFLGAGDALFWMVPCIYFTTPRLFLYFTSSLIFSLIAHLVLRRCLRREAYPNTVPLAGFQSVWMAVTVISEDVWG